MRATIDRENEATVLTRWRNIKRGSQVARIAFSARKNKTPTVFTRSEFLSRGSPPRELLRSANPNS